MVGAARNALRHALSLPVCSDPALSEEVETLAREIAGPGTNAETRAKSPKHRSICAACDMPAINCCQTHWPIPTSILAVAKRILILRRTEWTFPWKLAGDF